MRTKDVILSFASKGREPYREMLLRLIDSCIDHWHGDMLVYSPDHELQEYRGVTINKGWPQPKGIKSYTHQEMPYQFKTAMIQLALEQGYERIIWLDSSLQLLKNPYPLFGDREGTVFFHNLGHDLYKYISDDAANHFHWITEEKLKTIPQVWGGAFGLDFTVSWVNNFFEHLKHMSLNGSFKDGFSNRTGFISHRHDQAVMSMLYNGTGKELQPYGKIVVHPHELTGEYGTDNYILYKGL